MGKVVLCPLCQIGYRVHSYVGTVPSVPDLVPKVKRVINYFPRKEQCELVRILNCWYAGLVGFPGFPDL